MSDVVIRAENLGKKYLIGHQAKAERYVALRDVVARTAKGFVRSARDMVQGRQLVAGDEIEEFWALKDVNLEIKRGDVVGIIGRNGAGKSTLLKILSRITEPSTGRVEIKGRVASLLEVGTGFHPELTGRENIYLNGAILGMSRAEIKRKFEEIVAFAEVEKFLDTPVKHYSSGMYVRLAFAVAAHLEPEILVVDEVLAVGDAEFQKKCLGKMGEVAGHGRTVLFVSHNMGALARLCMSALFLKGGRLQFYGSTEAAIAAYINKNNIAEPLTREAYPIAKTCILDVNLATEITRIEGCFVLSIAIHEDDSFELRAVIRTSNYETVGLLSVGGFGGPALSFAKGLSKVTISVDLSTLAQGQYYVEFEALRRSDAMLFKAPHPVEFNHTPPPQQDEAFPLSSDWGFGAVRFPAKVSTGRLNYTESAFASVSASFPAVIKV